MEELRTNRNLYEFVLRFMENHKKTTRTLEEYLCSLWSIVSRYRDSESLSLTDFVTILEGALAAPVPKFVPVCPSSELKSIPEYAGFEEWEETILVQIALLREMNLNGTLENEQRYFGVETPDGSSWYNFDPLTYLECGIVGAFGGWEPEDDTGRQLVPGKVLKNTDGGEALDLGPRDVQRPVLELRSISWADFIKFLECGRYYE
jgi:hypothetical protein